MWALIGTGLLLKGLIAALFLIAAGLLYLGFTRQLFMRKIRRRLSPGRWVPLLLMIAAPWHVVAAMRNPPYLDLFGFHHAQRAGRLLRLFFWFYFINEHILRFLNLRYPRGYNTAPRGLFWGLHLLWLFPWRAYFPAALRLSYRNLDRASRTRFMALCWCGLILAFFTLSTTQEYYSIPCCPALALLLDSAMASDNGLVKSRNQGAGVGLLGCRRRPSPRFCGWCAGRQRRGILRRRSIGRMGEAYTPFLAHAADLTLSAFVYLRAPLALARVACVIGAARAWRSRCPVPAGIGRHDAAFGGRERREIPSHQSITFLFTFLFNRFWS